MKTMKKGTKRVLFSLFAVVLALTLSVLVYADSNAGTSEVSNTASSKTADTASSQATDSASSETSSTSSSQATDNASSEAANTTSSKTPDTASSETSSTPTVAVTGIKLNKKVMGLGAGAPSQTLTATVTPSDAASQILSWSSSDTSVATVSSDGTVTPLAKGTTFVTATTADGKYKATCKVYVVTRPFINL